jgi:hypothetical protein
MTESTKRQVAEAINDLEWLQSQPQWRRFAEFIQKQADARKRLCLKTISSPEEQAAFNFHLGEVSGLETILAAPDLLLNKAIEEHQKISR